MRISLAVFALFVGAHLSASARGAEPSLQDRLLKEPPAALVKAARERGIEFDELVWRVLETSFASRGTR